MSVFVHILAERDFDNDPVLPFKPLIAVSAAERARWDAMKFIPLNEFVAPFASEGVPVALTLILNGQERRVTAIAGFARKTKRRGFEQTARPGGGMLTRVFHVARGVSVFSQAAVSDYARTHAFVPRIMRAFNAVDLRASVSHVTIHAVNTGPYVWMRYGAVPNLMPGFAAEAKARWAEFTRAAHEQGLRYDHCIGKWVRTLDERTTDAQFRAVFDKHASPLARNTLKAMILGDIRFLQKDGYLFERKDAHERTYADPIHLGLTFRTTDPHFQRHFLARAAQSIAEAPKPTLRQRLGL